MGGKCAGQTLSPREVLDLIPQQRPFRFVDEIEEISETRVVGSYTFRDDEFFYPGHFPGRPVTPGHILCETMAQVGVVALGIYNWALAAPPEEVSQHFTVATETEAEYYKVVQPGQRVVIEAERIYWRRKKLKSKVEMRFPDGTLVAAGHFAGIGVRHGDL